MSRILAFLSTSETLLLVNGGVTRTFMDFHPDVAGVALGTFVSCAGLYGTDHLAPRDEVELGRKDRARFLKALPQFHVADPKAAEELAKALAALPETTGDKTVKVRLGRC